MRRQPMLFVILFTLPFILLLKGCSSAPEVWPNKPGKKVLATFPPLYCFTQAVAGDDANVMCLMTKSGPHKVEWSTEDVLKMRGADLVISNGLGLDDIYVDKLKKSASKDVKVFEVGEALGDEQLLAMKHEHHGGKDEHGHEHGKYDPHVWLSPDRAMLMVDLIAKELGELDPGKKTAFDKRAGEYKAKLKELKDYGLAKFKDKTNKNIITQHDSLRYFEKDFGLKIVGSLRGKAGQDEGPKERADLIEECQKHKVAAICYEPQFSAAEVKLVRDTLKTKNLDAQLVEVDPMEMAAGTLNADFYLERMRKNIDNLAQALK